MITACNLSSGPWQGEEAQIQGLDAELCFDPVAERSWYRLTLTGLFGATVELPQCEKCRNVFSPLDMESPEGEYQESREHDHKHGYKFAWERVQSSHPYTFCSAECQREAEEDYNIELAEYRRAVAHGEYDNELDDLDYASSHMEAR